MSDETDTVLGPMSHNTSTTAAAVKPAATTTSNISATVANTNSSSSRVRSTRVPRGSTSSTGSAGSTGSTSSSSSTALNKVPLALLRKAYRRLTNTSDHHHPHAHIHTRIPPTSPQSQGKSLTSPIDGSAVADPFSDQPLASQLPHPHQHLIAGSMGSQDSDIFERCASTGNIYGSGTCCVQDLEHGEEVLVSSEGIPTHLNGEDFTIPTLDLTTELVTDPHISFELIKLKLCDRKRSRSFISNSLMSSLDGDSLKEVDNEEGDEMEEEDEVDPLESYQENDADDATTKNSVASVRSAPYAMLAMKAVPKEEDLKTEPSEARESVSELPRVQKSPTDEYVVLDYYSFNELVHHRPKYVNKSRDYILDPTTPAS